ncbi:MAG: RsmB/NOP family class I SAM-dependent RNA methyltransferase [Oligoflexia bacterium]|nr:RsmB/NOP family class I SAM-dependent RNA methyltransferase [Oligoflexia bacterium]
MKYHANLVKSVIEILKNVFESGDHADKLIDRSFKANRRWGSSDRHFVAETVYEMIRWWRLLSKLDEGDWVPGSDAGWARRWATYELWRHGRTVDWKWVVEKLGIQEGTFSANEIEKRILALNVEKLGVRTSFPDWLVHRLAQQYPIDLEKILTALNRHAPVCLRVNALKGNRDSLMKRFKEINALVEPHQEVNSAIVLQKRSNVFSTPMFKEGLFEVQDVASQRVAALLDPKPNEKVADVCAGAGGKTLHLAALMENKGILVACDPLKYKLIELKKRARRAGCSNIRTEVLGSTKFSKRHAKYFDKVLLDVPCSGTGVFRRNPDTKWKLSEAETERLKGIQKEILSQYSKMVKPGGRLVYSTCSLLKEENRDQVNWFLKVNPDFKLIKDDERRPDLHEEDGFYMALLERVNHSAENIPSETH